MEKKKLKMSLISKTIAVSIPHKDIKYPMCGTGRLGTISKKKRKKKKTNWNTASEHLQTYGYRHFLYHHNVLLRVEPTEGTK